MEGSQAFFSIKTALLVVGAPMMALTAALHFGSAASPPEDIPDDKAIQCPDGHKQKVENCPGHFPTYK